MDKVESERSLSVVVVPFDALTPVFLFGPTNTTSITLPSDYVRIPFDES
jgi:hypothetical protein